jgi:hypothetical protein
MYLFIQIVAVGVGFEPTEPLGSTVFKTAAFDHSASPPIFKIKRGSFLPRLNWAPLIQLFVKGNQTLFAKMSEKFRPEYLDALELWLLYHRSRAPYSVIE